eukprot:GHVT01005687.1.p1 GENE.GHVT01005687.1~~GHVT01005687.1.p1  ORF type:complete len:150 (+),score=16.20 GHVT01005687.1:349-798(+)
MWGGRGVTCKAATCYSMFLSPWPPNSTSPQGTLPLASGVAVFAFGRREKSTVAGAARGSLERLALQTHGKTPWWQGVVPKRGAGIPGRSKRKPDKMTASPTAAAQMLREVARQPRINRPTPRKNESCFLRNAPDDSRQDRQLHPHGSHP